MEQVQSHFLPSGAVNLLHSCPENGRCSLKCRLNNDVIRPTQTLRSVRRCHQTRCGRASTPQLTAKEGSWTGLQVSEYIPLKCERHYWEGTSRATPRCNLWRVGLISRPAGGSQEESSASPPAGQLRQLLPRPVEILVDQSPPSLADSVRTPFLSKTCFADSAFVETTCGSLESRQTSTRGRGHRRVTSAWVHEGGQLCAPLADYSTDCDYSSGLPAARAEIESRSSEKCVGEDGQKCRQGSVIPPLSQKRKCK